MSGKSKASRRAQAAYNARELAAYRAYVAEHGPVKGGQKGYRRLLRRLPVAQRPAASLSRRQRDTLSRSLGALASSRRLGMSLSAAAKEHGTSPATVRRYLGRSGYRKRNGWYRPTKRDSLRRSMPFYEAGKFGAVVVPDSATSSLLGRYLRDVRTWFDDVVRRPQPLEKWRGVAFVDAEGRPHRLETDPLALRLAIEAHEAEFGEGLTVSGTDLADAAAEG